MYQSISNGFACPAEPFSLASRFGLSLAALVITGCAAVSTPDYVSDSEFCHGHLSGFSDATDRVFYRPDVQPYFALTRLQADFDPATLSPEAFSEWRSRVVDHSWQELAAAQRRQQGFAEDASRSCLVELAALTPVASWQTYREAAAEHDLYRDWQRWAGLYPVSAWVVEGRIQAEQEVWQEIYGDPLNAADFSSVTHYALDSESADMPHDAAEVARWFAEAYEDSALDLPQLRSGQLQSLFAMHAPELKMLVASEADQLGAVQVSAAPEAPMEPAFVPEPISYIDTHLTRFNGDYYLQLAYTFWFPERPRENALDLYGGPWNGITWRVTLDAQGQPMWFDSIHNCGCYHHVWLPDTLQPHPDMQGEEPLYLPYDWSGRPRLTLMPGTHYIRNVEAASTAQPDSPQPYALLPYPDLLVMSAGNDQYVSFFNARGIVDTSHRLERFVLWPFGVQSPGAMRRNGAHTIAFIGKRHFDGPDLFDVLLTDAPPESKQ